MSNTGTTSSGVGFRTWTKRRLVAAIDANDWETVYSIVDGQRDIGLHFETEGVDCSDECRLCERGVFEGDEQ